MQGAFGYVLFGTVIVAALIAVVTLMASGKTYDQIGKGGLSLRDGSDRPAHEPRSGGASYNAVRDDEIRQMLEARNARRARQGRPQVDVEAEIAALTRATMHADPQLEAEVRSHVEARNARRARQGKPALDVEAEVRRQLADLG